jgi:membrane associated rhomboid family serine protease
LQNSFFASLLCYPSAVEELRGETDGNAAGFDSLTSRSLSLRPSRLCRSFPSRWGFVWFHWIRLPAWFVFVLWILFQIIGTLEQKAGMSSVSSAAHLGGAAVGVVAWIVWRRSSDERRILNDDEMTKSE